MKVQKYIKIRQLHLYDILNPFFMRRWRQNENKTFSRLEKQMRNMNDQETIEIEASKLSQDVVDELVDEDIMDKEQAQNLGDKIWMEEVADQKPNKASSLEYIKSLLSWNIDLMSRFTIGSKSRLIDFGSGIKSYISNKKSIIGQRTVFADVVSVEPKKNKQNLDKVIIELENNEIGRFEVEIDLKSTGLSNIMAYKSVDNPKQLEGEKLLISRESFTSSMYNNNETSILIPHNVSKSGKIRFKLYSLSREVFKKSRVKGLYQGSVEELLFAYIITGIASVFLFAGTSGSIFSVLGIISVILWGSVAGFHSAHIVFTIINAITCLFLKSDYEKIEKRS